MKPQIPQISTVLSILRPGSSWVLRGEELYENIIWEDKLQSKPTIEEIEEELKRLQLEYQKTEYQRLRAKEYPSFAEQFDLLYHGGYDVWKEEINKIKDKYPKPE
jgi:hypothetical protein